MYPMNHAAGAGSIGSAEGGDNTNRRGLVNQSRPSPAQANSHQGPQAGQPIHSVQARSGGSITRHDQSAAGSAQSGAGRKHDAKRQDPLNSGNKTSRFGFPKQGKHKPAAPAAVNAGSGSKAPGASPAVGAASLGTHAESSGAAGSASATAQLTPGQAGPSGRKSKQAPSKESWFRSCFKFGKHKQPKTEKPSSGAAVLPTPKGTQAPAKQAAVQGSGAQDTSERSQALRSAKTPPPVAPKPKVTVIAGKPVLVSARTEGKPSTPPPLPPVDYPQFEPLVITNLRPVVVAPTDSLPSLEATTLKRLPERAKPPRLRKTPGTKPR